MNKNIEELDELLASKFEGAIVSALVRDDYEYKAIRTRVLDICVDTKLILDQTKEVRSKNYAWVKEVIEINIVALELLDKATTTLVEPISLSNIKRNVNVKAEAIVKDIVKRMLNTQLPFPVSVGE